MSVVFFARSEIDIVGRQQRQSLRICQIDHRRLNAGFVIHAVAHELDIETIGENFRETGGKRPRGIILPIQ